MLFTLWEFFLLQVKTAIWATVALLVLGLGLPKATLVIMAANDVVIEEVLGATLPQVPGGRTVLLTERFAKWLTDKGYKWAARRVSEQDPSRPEAVLRLVTARGGLLYAELHFLFWAFFRIEIWARWRRERRRWLREGHREPKF